MTEIRHIVFDIGKVPIDDSRKNVDGAIDAGWQTVLFTDAATLRKDLAARGIEA